MKKVLSLFLSILMLFSLTAGIELSASAAGNSISNATLISFNTQYNGNITNNNEKDVYKFTLSSSGRINLNVKANIYETDYYIYDSEGKIVCEYRYCYWNENTQQMTLNETVDLNKGTYYFAVVINEGTGNYKFNICKHSKSTTIITKATISKNGSKITKCADCGIIKTKSTIYYPKTISIATSYTYNGKVKTPSVTVKDSKGKKISSKYYTVTYSKGRKYVGKYTVTIKFKGNYSGTVKKTFTIKPKSTSISRLTAGKKKFTVKWKKQSTQTTGYQIQYSTSSKFKSYKTVTVGSNKTASKTISKLKAKKKYYVRVRTYKVVKVNGKNTKIYSSWSKAKAVTTKK